VFYFENDFKNIGEIFSVMNVDYDDLLKRALELLPEKRTVKSRFKPPVVVSFCQGNRTVIKNFKEICETLRRDENFVAKYFSKELAVPVKTEGGILILQGKFDEKSLNERLDYFIKKYVICKECKQPDTKLESEGRGVVVMVCEACGARSTMGV